MPRHPAAIGLATIVLACLVPQGAFSGGPEPGRACRLIVLTDIEADPDDTQSVIEIQGLIAVTSTHQRTFVAPESIRRVIETYDKVRGNLTKHDASYPAAEALLPLVKQGLPEYGMRGVGTGKDSEGSERIIKVLEKEDDRPLWIAVWDGASTLAQALHKIRATRDAEDAKRLLARLRVYTISDQDDSGAWIRRTFPELFYIVSPGGYAAGTWTGINQVVPGIDNSLHRPRRRQPQLPVVPLSQSRLVPGTGHHPRCGEPGSGRRGRIQGRRAGNGALHPEGH